MHIPIKHLSVRVPWHDNGWNGKVCCNPKENGSCMFLPRINETKNVETEEKNIDKWFHELNPDELPPCVGEKVHFMSPHNIYKKLHHPYSENDSNKEYYDHYMETTYCYPGYSFSVVPYNWMLKNSKHNTSEKAEELKVDYDANREPKLNFANSWVQQFDNQKALLDTFINPIQVNKSLVFIYAKNIPHIETTSRVLLGVCNIEKIGDLTEYEYDSSKPKTFQSTLWERPIYHTLREGFENGFILPYHEFFELIEKDDSLNINDYIALAPSFEEFSFGTEWVSNDTAIESLLILQEKLKKFQNILPNKNYEKQIRWIDNELSKIWKMRGPFPGLGAVLSGLKLVEGNLISWEIDKLIRDEKDNVIKNPWDFVELLFKGDTTFLSTNVKVLISDTHKRTWNNLSDEEKMFLQLLSRMNVSNEQVELVVDLRKKEQIEYLINPYLLYERNRLNEVNFSISLIDKAIFSSEHILEKFPLPPQINISSPLDQERIRAYGIQILEQSALEGHTIMTDEQFVTKFDELPLENLCNPSIKNILAIEEFLSEEIIKGIFDEDDEKYYFKLKRFEDIKKKIQKFVKGRTRRKIDFNLNSTWDEVFNYEFGFIQESAPGWYQKRDKEARREKAKALDILSENRVSVLIGPAGTGKTTLLEIFCKQPYISNGTILKLAPTGKARVNLGKDAQTIAQFLIGTKRYDPYTGQYYINEDASRVSFNTVIVDEASMITENQLAALIDSLTGVDRFILVGDYRQLPPIGTGRPFVDIKNFLEDENKGVAELKTLFRQFSTNDNIPDEEPSRFDVRLGKWFSDDNIKKDEVDIFQEVQSLDNNDFGNIKFIEWHNVKNLEEILINITNDEIVNILEKENIPNRNPQANFDASLGATKYYENSNWSGFGIESAKEIENWQILSPTRTSGYGTKVLNQQIQKVFRGDTKQKAIFPGKFKKRKMNKPIGDDGIVYGDKVINTKNLRWNKPWNEIYNPSKISSEDILKYIANGEIGIHIGKYGDWKGQRPLNITFSSQPKYAYTFKEADFQEDGDIQMELAYSITVHKSQGSGFNTVIFVLPNPCPILSRELLYTALTRQEDRIIILHQGEFKDFKKFTTDEYSETARRLTDLFYVPTIKEIKQKYYDTRYIQISENGEFMISKSEVIIADKLYYNKIKYAYETPLSDDSGVTIHPDFTIEDDNTGIIYYWEHLGMLTDDGYRSKWTRKKEWYERNNILEYTEDQDADKQLIITRDKPDGGIDSQEIKRIIDELFI
ncbi:ATP-dependent DNA helicase [Halarcobacter sp.]|uniref:ATP-dependent DNA helicase n=1 Tax=Halarcobacter sp. TaxID=2321133 RepID=UPI003A952D9A